MRSVKCLRFFPLLAMLALLASPLPAQQLDYFAASPQQAVVVPQTPVLLVSAAQTADESPGQMVQEPSGPPAMAADVATGWPDGGGCLDGCDCGECESAGCSQCASCGRWIANVELVVLDYDREEGTRVGSSPQERVDWELELSPRVTLGWVGSNGMGLRGRWWMYDHSRATVSGEPLSQLSIETYNVDMEFFSQYYLTDRLTAEISLGARYNSFEEMMRDGPFPPPDFRLHSFHGWGPLLGLEGKWYTGFGLTLYAGVRASFLWDTLLRINDPTGGEVFVDQIPNSSQSILETGGGVEFCQPLGCRSLLTGRIGFEYQTWSNYSSRFSTFQNGQLNEDQWGGRSDVNFVGFVGALGIEY